MASSSNLGTKRIDPENGRKFYDLGKDPIVSPYTGKSYPRAFFEAASIMKIVQNIDKIPEPQVDPFTDFPSLEDEDSGVVDGEGPIIEGEDAVEDDDAFLVEDEDDPNDLGPLVPTQDHRED